VRGGEEGLGQVRSGADQVRKEGRRGWRTTRLRSWGRDVGSMAWGVLNGKYYTNPLAFFRGSRGPCFGSFFSCFFLFS
jgi:hypothetical protein